MKKTIITISREFGSGGRTIGHQVAEKLGYPYYDKELIKTVAEKTGFDPNYVEEYGEYSPGKSLLSLLSSFTGAHGTMGGMSVYDFLYVVQRKAILEVAEQGPCVIVGRCADYILKDREDALHVFVHADEAFKAERIVRLYGESEKKPEERLKEKDTKRAVNYKHFTDRNWGDCRNYDLSLNSGKLGIDRCVELIVQLANEE